MILRLEYQNGKHEMFSDVKHFTVNDVVQPDGILEKALIIYTGTSAVYKYVMDVLVNIRIIKEG